MATSRLVEKTKAYSIASRSNKSGSIDHFGIQVNHSAH